jgi:hypothetical protein
VFKNFSLCGETIPQLKGYKAFNYLGEHKAPALAKTNQKPSLPRGLNEERCEAYEGKCALAIFKARVAQLDTPVGYPTDSKITLCGRT